MTKIRFIGDVHGKVEQYLYITALACGLDGKPTIQVGDFGVGFVPFPKNNMGWLSQNYFIRGNHDDPIKSAAMPGYIADGFFDTKDKIMFIGGAHSIDWRKRTIGRDWWPDEECSYEQLQGFIEKYSELKPKTMVTHDCPQSLVHYLNPYAVNDVNRTRQALQAMLDVHRPELWVMGHWHTSFDQVIDGTRFVCLNELEWKDIEV